jgi:hypothetical protein
MKKMKKTVLVISMAALLLTAGMKLASAQEQPQPKKDTVNMDTDAKPQFYYPVEDEKAAGTEKGGFPVLPVVGVVVVVAGIGAFFVLKKKK